MATLIFIILFILLALILFVPTIFFAIVGYFISLFGRRKSSEEETVESESATSDDVWKRYRSRVKRKSASRKKIFDDDEGEYVSFEEVKDKDKL